MINAGNVNVAIFGNINISDIIKSGVNVNCDKEMTALKAEIESLKKDNCELKKNKAILHELVTFLQDKK